MPPSSPPLSKNNRTSSRLGPRLKIKRADANMTGFRSIYIVAAFFFIGLPREHAAPLGNDHLVPLSEYDLAKTGSGADYRKLWQRKLLVTPGNIARFAHIPGFAQPEAAVCVNKRTEQKDGIPGGYWVTLTEASKSLWDCIPSGDEKFTKRSVADPRTVNIRRCDAPLPDSTALIIHTLWLKMLRAF